MFNSPTPRVVQRCSLFQNHSEDKIRYSNVVLFYTSSVLSQNGDDDASDTGIENGEDAARQALLNDDDDDDDDDDENGEEDPNLSSDSGLL